MHYLLRRLLLLFFLPQSFPPLFPSSESLFLLLFLPIPSTTPVFPVYLHFSSSFFWSNPCFSLIIFLPPLTSPHPPPALRFLPSLSLTFHPIPTPISPFSTFHPLSFLPFYFVSPFFFLQQVDIGHRCWESRVNLIKLWQVFFTALN